MHTRIFIRDFVLGMVALVVWLAVAAPARASYPPEVDAGFRLLYELKFAHARAQFFAWEEAHPEDPLGSAAEAASYLFEEFYAQGVLTAEFFLDNKRFLGGITGRPDDMRRAAFMAANGRAQRLAQARLKASAKDADALLALTISLGMQADYLSIIEKKQLEGLRFVKEAEARAKDLLALDSNAGDAYLAIGAANYIIGSLPGYKRFFLWFGGIHGDKAGGMQQLQAAAMRGHYLRPCAKMMLALAALREKQPDLARSLLIELTAEFPQNPLFTRELTKVARPERAIASSP